MSDDEHEQTTVEDAGALLRAIGTDLERGSATRLDTDEGVIDVDPPEEVGVEVEVEFDGEGSELEVELSWDGPLDAGAGEAESHGDAEEEPATDPAAVTASQATFELFQDRAEEWRWRLRHDNGNIIADSGEGYGSIGGARNGLRSVRENAPGAEAVRED